MGRLPSNVRESDIEQFFKGYGKLREILLKDGYGFIVSVSVHASLLELLLSYANYSVSVSRAIFAFRYANFEA